MSRRKRSHLFATSRRNIYCFLKEKPTPLRSLRQYRWMQQNAFNLCREQLLRLEM
eukprot:jgi/Psemu1/307797/fgenesh1_kg.354_\